MTDYVAKIVTVASKIVEFYMQCTNSVNKDWTINRQCKLT